jgi:hypothetical protein
MTEAIVNHSTHGFLSHLTNLGFLGCLLLGLTSVTSPGRGSDASERRDYLNGGYYLFHHLCDDEAKLPLLLVVKTTPPEIEKFADRISKTAKESSAALDHMQDGDSHLRFDQNPLPPFERDVRESISDEKQHQLLFGTSNGDFVRALLVSQSEASSYGCNLAKVLAEHEKKPERVKTLQHLSAKWSAIHEETMRLLRN